MLNVVITLVLLVVYILFGFMDTAFHELSRSKVKSDAEAGVRNAQLLWQHIEDEKAEKAFVASMQLGLVVFLIGIVLSSLPKLELLAQAVPGAWNIGIGVVAAILVIVPANLFSRSVGDANATRSAYALIGIMSLFAKLTYPVSRLTMVLSSVAISMTARGIQEEDEIKDEIIMMVDEGSESGVLDEREHKMIHRVFKFDTRTAEDISVHRTKISALPLDSTADEVISLLAQEQFTRIPVYSDNLDNIEGILHAKDVLNHLGKGASLPHLSKIIRAPYLVPFSKKIDELFIEMKHKQVHMVIVLDEYGGTVGLLTMEDIVEEVMGSILDEHDEEEPPDIERISEGRFAANGVASLEEVAEQIGCTLPVEEYETLGGFIIAQLGRIPEEDEKPELNYEGMMFHVTNIEDNRISKVIIYTQASK